MLSFLVPCGKFPLEHAKAEPVNMLEGKILQPARRFAARAPWVSRRDAQDPAVGRGAAGRGERSPPPPGAVGQQPAGPRPQEGAP